MSSEYTVERFLEYVRTSRSKNTLRMYKEGLKRFTEWYGKTSNEILAERVSDWTSADLFQKKRFARQIEKFHVYLIKEKGYAPNSATYYCQGIRLLFSFYEMPVRVSSEIDRRKMTTRDYVPRIDQYAEMFKVADNLRDKLIVSMGLNLALRISDFAKIKKADLPNLDIEPPIPFEVLTQKEETLAKSFLSDETVELLKQYLPTLSEENQYLFPSNGTGHLDHTTFNRIVKDLARAAKLKIPKRKRIRFHCFRKRFLSEAANLRIDPNIAKLLTGKAVEHAMLAYLSEINLRSAFERISERLRLTEKKSVKTTDAKEAEELRKRLDRLERRQNIIAAINPDVVRRADEMLKNLGITLSKEAFIKMTFGEKLDMIAKEQEKREQEEYQKMIAENGNNTNH
jgi:integrase